MYDYGLYCAFHSVEILVVFTLAIPKKKPRKTMENIEKCMENSCLSVTRGVTFVCVYHCDHNNTHISQK